MESISSLVEPFEAQREEGTVKPTNNPIPIERRMLPIEDIKHRHEKGEQVYLDEKGTLMTQEWLEEEIKQIAKAKKYNSRKYNFSVDVHEEDYYPYVWVEVSKPETEEEAIEIFTSWLKEENELVESRINNLRSNTQIQNPEKQMRGVYEKAWSAIVQGTDEYLEWLKQDIDEGLYKEIEFEIYLTGAAHWMVLSDVRSKLGEEQNLETTNLKAAIFGIINQDLMTQYDNGEYYRDPQQFWTEILETSVRTPEVQNGILILYKGSSADVVTKRAIREVAEIRQPEAHQDVLQGIDVFIQGENGEFPAEIKSVSSNIPVNEAILEIWRIGPDTYMLKKLDGTNYETDRHGLVETYSIPKNMVSYAASRPNGPVGLSIRVPVSAIDPAKKDSETRREFEEGLKTAVLNFDKELAGERN